MASKAKLFRLDLYLLPFYHPVRIFNFRRARTFLGIQAGHKCETFWHALRPISWRYQLPQHFLFFNLLGLLPSGKAMPNVAYAGHTIWQLGLRAQGLLSSHHLQSQATVAAAGGGAFALLSLA